MQGHALPDEGAHACCAPALSPVPVAAPEASRPEPGAAPAGRGGHRVEQAVVPAQTFLMGDARGDGRPADGEGPVHPVSLGAFSIDVTAVTNADFLRFTEETGYRTEAEALGFSAVFHLALEGPREAVLGVAPDAPWWLGVRGADWRHPGGPDSGLRGLDAHPVVHVSWYDASAYCAWAGRALPTEAQWEAASRGGLPSARYPWGDDRRDGAMNIWQGVFPARSTRADGRLTTVPVRSFAPNAYGLWQTVGNVWEWCADRFEADYYARSPRHDPRGPASGDLRVLRGGSYLCHDSYCNRYRNSARSSNTPDSSMGNAGFRTVVAT